MINTPACFKNPENLSCADLIPPPPPPHPGDFSPGVNNFRYDLNIAFHAHITNLGDEEFENKYIKVV